MPAPCCTDYWRASDYAGAESEGVLSSEAKEFAPDPAQLEMRLCGADMVFLGNPSDPTGVATPADAIRALAKKFPGVIFVVDESFMEFVPEALGASLLGAPLPANVIVLRSPTAIYGLPGLRLGFMFAGRTLIEQVQAAREPNAVGALALCAGEALLAGAQEAPALRQPVIAERERVRDELSRMAGIRVFRSQANFLLLKTTRPGLSAHAALRAPAQAEGAHPQRRRLPRPRRTFRASLRPLGRRQRPAARRVPRRARRAKWK